MSLTACLRESMSISLIESNTSPLLISTKLAGDCGVIVSTEITSLFSSSVPLDDFIIEIPMDPDNALASMT